MANTKTAVNPQAGGQNLAVSFAKQELGVPYSWGGGTPSGPTYGIAQGASIKGYDCSSLVQAAFAKEGVDIGRTTYQQYQEGTAVGANQLQPGDAVFFKGSDSENGLPGHVGLYVGNGQYIEAPHTGGVVQTASLANASDFVGARRYTGGLGAAKTAANAIGTAAFATNASTTGNVAEPSHLPGDPEGVAGQLPGDAQLAIKAPPATPTQIAAQRVSSTGKQLSLSLVTSAQKLLNGGTPDLPNLYALASGFQNAKKAAVTVTAKPPLGSGTPLVKAAGMKA